MTTRLANRRAKGAPTIRPRRDESGLLTTLTFYLEPDVVWTAIYRPPWISKEAVIQAPTVFLSRVSAIASALLSPTNLKSLWVDRARDGPSQARRPCPMCIGNGQRAGGSCSGGLLDGGSSRSGPILLGASRCRPARQHSRPARRSGTHGACQRIRVSNGRERPGAVPQCL